MGAWGVTSSADYAFWAVLFYGLALLCILGNVVLLFVLPSSAALRRRSSTLFYWSMALWHLVNAAAHTPWFQGSFKALGSVPRGLPWLCWVAPLALDVSFNIELVSILALAAGFLSTLKRAKGKPILDLAWSSTTKWLVLVFIWIWSVVSSLPWSIPKLHSSAYADNIGGTILRVAVPMNVNDTNGLLEYRCKVPVHHAYWYKWYSAILSFGFAGVLTMATLVVTIILAVKALRCSDAQVHPHAKADVKALLFMIIKFSISWVPVWVIFLAKQIAPSSLNSKWDYFQLVMMIVKWLHEHPGFWNILILPIFIPLIRRAFRRFFTCTCAAEEEDVTKTTNGYQNGANQYYR